MKKLVLFAGALAIAVAMLTSSGVASATFMFMLTGAIPGTSFILPPLAMFAIMTTGLWLLIASASKKMVIRYRSSRYVNYLHKSVKFPKVNYKKLNLS